MSDDDKQKPPPVDDGHRPRPARNLAEAVGRAAGDALKGASPVAASRQLLLEIRNLLETHLDDPEGSLRRTILAHLENDAPLLGRHLGDSEGALVHYLDRVLADDGTLDDLVRDADARWGRDYVERPRFETGAAAPAADDPYTRAGVRTALVRLRAGLEG